MGRKEKGICFFRVFQNWFHPQGPDAAEARDGGGRQRLWPSVNGARLIEMTFPMYNTLYGSSAYRRQFSQRICTKHQADMMPFFR